MNRNIALILVKIALTVPVTYALASPFLSPSVAGGVFKEVETLGIFGSVVFAALFLAMVFLYCRDLYRALSLVHPSARKASPRSVWLMFLIPYNFVEDFFIISNVASSLRQEAQHNIALHPFKSFGMVSGLGWCAAQIVSLLPNEVGSIAGVIALPFWIIHWRFVRRVNAVLTEAARANMQATHSSQPTALGGG
ncbi:MAG: hypothetical protein ACT6S0_19690 [Roseateles sp.]|uniref:hypothetical protein n=1 Tax=Roseateles sp. TaxID=1971397 RepID=UPI004035F359